MGIKYLFDTNIFIAQLINDPKAVQFFSTSFISENKIITSQIVRMELLSYPKLTNENEADIIKILQQFEIIMIDEFVESEVINIRKKYKVKLPDAIIAATAITEEATLISFNIKDFEKVENLKLFYDINP